MSRQTRSWAAWLRCTTAALVNCHRYPLYDCWCICTCCKQFNFYSFLLQTGGTVVIHFALLFHWTVCLSVDTVSRALVVLMKWLIKASYYWIHSSTLLVYYFLSKQVPQFGPLFDGAIVDHISLPVLVRATAINALRARRDIHMAYRGRYKIYSTVTSC